LEEIKQHRPGDKHSSYREQAAYCSKNYVLGALQWRADEPGGEQNEAQIEQSSGVWQDVGTWNQNINRGMGFLVAQPIVLQELLAACDHQRERHKRRVRCECGYYRHLGRVHELQVAGRSGGAQENR